MDTLLQTWNSFEDLTAQYIGYAWRQQEDQTERFDWNHMPMSGLVYPILGALTYLTGIKLLEYFMKNRRSAFEVFPGLKWILFLHNLLLTVVSAYMCFGTLKAVSGRIVEEGFFEGWIDSQWVSPKTTDLGYWCYLFYVSKYYELLDTVFIVLKKRPTQFVQSWHHTVVMFMFWMGMETRMFCYWPLVVFNTFVHIFVYGYFVCASIGIRVPWKHIITIMQISQFWADMTIGFIWCFFKKYEYVQGDMFPFYFCTCIGASFIYLFTRVYFDVRRRQKKNKAKKLK